MVFSGIVCINVIWIKVIWDFQQEKYHYQYHESQKWQSLVLIVKNGNNQWNKSERDSRYLEYESKNDKTILKGIFWFISKCFIKLIA